MRIPDELRDVLESTPGTLSGAVRFRDTRVPVQALLDTLDDGEGIDSFLDGWPGVSREAAAAVIRWQQNQARRTFGLEVAI